MSSKGVSLTSSQLVAVELWDEDSVPVAAVKAGDGDRVLYCELLCEPSELYTGSQCSG